MGKRQDAALQTRKKIIEAMKELLDEKKAEEINIEEITQRAHIAKGSFYTHFKRKEAASLTINSIILPKPKRFFALSILYPKQKSANSPATFLNPIKRK